MYEFHGWATIREAFNEENENEDYLDKIFGMIIGYIKLLNWHSGFIDVKSVNGAYHFCISGFRNHKDSLVDDLFELYAFIARIAPGSYGILYARDDDVENKFRAFILKRGTLVEYEDPFLSPFIPTVEDKS